MSSIAKKLDYIFEKPPNLYLLIFLVTFLSLLLCRGEISAVICLSVGEVGGSGIEKLNKCLPPSPAVLSFVNVRERKPR